MSIREALIVVQLGALFLMGLLAWISDRYRDAGLVDVGWSGGIGLAVAFYAIVFKGYCPRELLVVSMLGFWAARLVYYILKDRFIGHAEDSRYQYLRNYWGPSARRNFSLLFIAEAPLITLFSVPALIVMFHPAQSLRIWDGLGLAIWFLSLFGEITSDRQLERFRNNPANKGKTCREGLWRYSRHPNYFFEALHWWAYVVMAFGAPYFWWTLVGPIGICLFLFYLTGIPHTERQALSKRPDYAEYQRTTSMFIPWFPKSK